jgi:hypothetical protein
MCCRCKRSKTEIEAQSIFLDPFTVCSLCKRKFAVCPFAEKETKGIYPLQTNYTDQTNCPSMPIATPASAQRCPSYGNICMILKVSIIILSNLLVF